MNFKFKPDIDEKALRTIRGNLEKRQETHNIIQLKVLVPNLWYHLQSRNIAPSELAKNLKVHENTIYAWRFGRSLPSIQNIGKIARFLNINIDEFVFKNNFIDYTDFN